MWALYDLARPGIRRLGLPPVDSVSQLRLTGWVSRSAVTQAHLQNADKEAKALEGSRERLGCRYTEAEARQILHLR